MKQFMFMEIKYHGEYIDTQYKQNKQAFIFQQYVSSIQTFLMTDMSITNKCI